MFAIIGKCPWCLQKTMIVGEITYPIAGDMSACYECGEVIKITPDNTFAILTKKDIQKLSHEEQQWLLEEQQLALNQLTVN